MEQFRGDAHKFYKKIKKAANKQYPVKKLREIDEIYKIQKFYESLPLNELKMIQYRMIKEQNGSGTFPLLISILPWLGLIFSKQIQETAEGNLLFIFIFLSFFTCFAIIFILLHYREQAWASVHTEILKDIIKRIEHKQKCSIN
ncbi:hypothetical protein [Alkalihalobacterium elongatum]|uniref:hypothetical protein n=1 Tax=Alkalihalobacterium elongatum TaxID=2675466 RepID=UPI001C20096A|nr:hypothetical protein [Alkalihalobacterium elongatum]